MQCSAPVDFLGLYPVEFFVRRSYRKTRGDSFSPQHGFSLVSWKFSIFCVVFLRCCYFWIFFGAVHPCCRFLFWVLCWWPTGSHSLSLAAWHKTQTPTNLQNHPPPRWNLCTTLAALAMRVRLSAFRTGPSSTGPTPMARSWSFSNAPNHLRRSHRAMGDYC